MNTGIADGHNLGWKLAWVARGLAGPTLLDSYEQERGTVGRANAEASLVSRMGQPTAASLDQNFGVVYASDGILDTGPLSGRRAPHAWVDVAGRPRSTLDLFDGRLTVISGPSGEQVLRTCRELACSGLPVSAYRVGVDILDSDGRLDEIYGSVATVGSSSGPTDTSPRRSRRVGTTPGQQWSGRSARRSDGSRPRYQLVDGHLTAGTVSGRWADEKRWPSGSQPKTR
jgi:hypothetical protein